MPKAYDYKITDIPEIIIPQKVIDYARKISPLLDKENRGQHTMDGGEFKNVKGTIGQWAVHRYLLDHNWKHDYAQPYVKEQYGDQYDIVFGTGDIWEVKTRDWWKPDYFYNIRLLMGTHEKDSFETKKCDHYIFVTVTKEYDKAYILGGIDGCKLWETLHDLEDDEKPHMRYPTEGKIYSRELTPILRVILRT